ncbi:hypothetical protein PCA20602_05086 [Pandoraea capi]|uniref:Transposase n=1 Tax=Pandoraea capi TaxID=2508286 RepID=A0ABY6WCE1_9BURK|nr:hypothetical protein PCA20602_05086 [Pandoraea capi]
MFLPSCFIEENGSCISLEAMLPPIVRNTSALRPWVNEVDSYWNIRHTTPRNL